MKHPVSDLLPVTSSIHITCSIPIANIESGFSGNYLKSIGTSIPLNIYGKIWRPISLSQKLPGTVERIEVKGYDFVIPSTGKKIKLTHSFQYSKEPATVMEVVG